MRAHFYALSADGDPAAEANNVRAERVKLVFDCFG
jgi:hypothetical protein